MQLKIWDKVSMWFDNLIGETVIDLEDRYFGLPSNVVDLSFEVYSKAINEKNDSAGTKEER